MGNCALKISCAQDESIATESIHLGDEPIESMKVSQTHGDHVVDTLQVLPTLLQNPKADPGALGSKMASAYAKKVTAEAQVFARLGWMPALGTPSCKALDDNFRGAIPGTALFHIVKSVTHKQLGMTPANTLYADSICPDEINHEKGDLASIMKEYWGACFPMGGIGGAPFVGKTGFSAFSHHVPDDGHLVLLFGPHVAVSETGEVGKYAREGQSNESSACGAVIAAYHQCNCGHTNCADDESYDMQQAWIRRQLAPHASRISKEACPMAALAHQAYTTVHDKISNIVNTDFGNGNLVLVGGIQINMPAPYEDLFLPKMFEVRAKGKDTVDLMHTLKM
jgi:hypothetical protein